MEYVLIIGAKSDIAKAVAREYAAKGYHLYLAARKSEELKTFSTDIGVRYNKKAVCVEIDILDFDSHWHFYQTLDPKPVGVVCAVGYLGNQLKAQADFEESKLIHDTNYTGCVSIINIIANDFEVTNKGFIVGISSVAGDRGRQSNYFYGSAKAAFSSYLSGLRNRMHKKNVHVLTVKPGYVDTQMTEHLDLPKILTGDPVDVAKDIVKAQMKGKEILYTRWMWKWIMLIIRSIPEMIFKRMNL